MAHHWMWVGTERGWRSVLGSRTSMAVLIGVPFVEVAGEERELAKFNGRRRSMDDRVEGTYVPAILPG